MTNENVSIPINCAPMASYAFLGIYTHEVGRLAMLGLPLRFDIYDYQGWKDG
jgi:hypothetical protein